MNISSQLLSSVQLAVIFCFEMYCISFCFCYTLYVCTSDERQGCRRWIIIVLHYLQHSRSMLQKNRYSFIFPDIRKEWAVTLHYVPVLEKIFYPLTELVARHVITYLSLLASPKMRERLLVKHWGLS